MSEGMEKLVAVVMDQKPQGIPHVPVSSFAFGNREKPEGRPLPKSPSSVEQFSSYLQRAAVIDYKPDATAVMFEKLKIVIAQNNILVYDSKVVAEWMAKMVAKERQNVVWVWKSLTEPLTKLGKVKPFSNRLRYQHEQWQSSRGQLGTIERKKRYTKVIPDAVLTTAEVILKNFEKTDPVFLLVSDYEVVQPDPFLAVAVPGYPFLIVDFWDEPGFQPKAAELASQENLNK